MSGRKISGGFCIEIAGKMWYHRDYEMTVMYDNGEVPMNTQTYELRQVSEEDYKFIYQVKKDAYKKYVEINFGSWEENKSKEHSNH